MKVGSNGTAFALVKSGTGALTSGTLTVSDSDVTASCTIVPTNLTFTGTPGAPYVSAQTTGTFTITSGTGATNVVKYLIFK